MITRPLGGSDVQASVVGLGCNAFGRRIDAAATRAVVDAALDAGVTFFDTADAYTGSEELLGRILAGRRDRVVIATKFGHDLGDGALRRGGREYIRTSVEGSLRRLRTDWIDLYQYHRPDGVTPIGETLSALDELVREGKVRAIGSSQLTAGEVEAARTAAERCGLTPFAAEQGEYSWLRRDAERALLPACVRLGVGFIPFFPLANGLLTGIYRRGASPPAGTRLRGDEIDDADLARVERLAAFAREHGVALLDVAIGGLAAQPAVVSVIAGATTPAQVRANAAAGAWRPTPAVLAELREL